MNPKLIKVISVSGESMKECSLKWLGIPDHPYRILITGVVINKKTYYLT